MTFDAAVMFRALSLGERSSLWKAQGGDIRSERRHGRIAALRARLWRSQPPFNSDNWLAKRLQSSGVQPNELDSLVSLVYSDVGARLTAPWIDDLTSAYRQSFESQPMVADALDANPEGALLYAVEPVIRKFEDKLRQSVSTTLEAFANAPFTADSACHFAAPALTYGLLRMISKALVLELNVKRLQGELSGETPKARYRFFVSLLRDPASAAKVLSEYPVMARRVSEFAASWCTAAEELYERLASDLPEIRATLLGGRDPGQVVNIDCTAGDRHRGGRSVAIVEFASGQKVVYKPRSLAVDARFQELLTWLEQRGGVAHRRLGVLERGTYGWTEFAENRACVDEAAVERFYFRMGSILGLLYGLRAADFHHENIVACGEHPVLVDLECLFTPLVGEHHEGRPAQRAMNQSVLATSILPQRIGLRDGPGVDISGLSSAEGQSWLFPQATVAGAGRDDMHVVLTRPILSRSANLPRGRGDSVDAGEYASFIERGFRDQYRALMSNREELLSEGGPLSRFADVEVRILFRMTATYSHMTAESYHPDLQQDALDLDRHWDHLWRSAPVRSEIAAIVPAEIAALRRGDVPLFTTTPGSRDLRSDSDDEFADFFSTSGLDAVKARLKSLDSSDCERQAWLIQATLGRSPKRVASVEALESGAPGEEEPTGTTDPFLAAAISAAERLMQLGYRENEQADWLGVKNHGDRRQVLPLPADLYRGVAGACFFLSYAARVVDSPGVRDFAHESLNTLLALSRRPDSVEGIGAFSGAGGVIYALAHVGHLLNREEALDAATELLATAASRIVSDTNMDVVAGSAGLAAGALSLRAVTGSRTALDVAERCGDHLLGKQTPHGGWLDSEGKMLAGFAHGASGIACILSDLFAAVGNPAYADAARRAVAFERSQYSTERREWPDLRPLASAAGVNPTPAAWCSGAAGIGLSRLHMKRIYDTDEFDPDIDKAVAIVLREGSGRDLSPCHGAFGGIELLSQAGKHQEAFRAGMAAVGELASTGLGAGHESGLETPGLMIGVAGMGYHCLRLAVLNRIPSVLLLQPPHA